MEDLKTGVSITDLGLNDFAWICSTLRPGQWRSRAPAYGLHAVVPADPEKACSPVSSSPYATASLVALAGGLDGSPIRQQNRLHPFYLVTHRPRR